MRPGNKRSRHWWAASLAAAAAALLAGSYAGAQDARQIKPPGIVFVPRTEAVAGAGLVTRFEVIELPRPGAAGAAQRDPAQEAAALARLQAMAQFRGGVGVQWGQQGQSEFVATLEYPARLRQRLEQLARVQEQQAWPEWVQHYQALVDEYPDGIVPLEEETYVGVRHHLAGLLRELPPEVLRLYRQQYDGEARDLYEKALTERDPALMRQVYGRFRHASVGPAALEQLAEEALDNGNPEIARLAYARSTEEHVGSPYTLLKYGLAAAAAGHAEEARGAFQRAEREFGNRRIQLSGQEATVAEAARQLAELTPPARTDGWGTFEGPTGLRHMRGALQGPLVTRWEYDIPEQSVNPISGIRFSVTTGGYGISRSRLSYLAYPTLMGDQVIIQAPRSVVSIGLQDGRELWTNDDFELRTGDIPVPAGGRPTLAFPVNTRTIQAAPAATGGLLFVRIPVLANETPDRRRQRGGPRNPDPRVTGGLGLVALNGRTGQQLWRRLGVDEVAGEAWNLPTVLDNAVFTGVASPTAGITEFRAVAYAAGTGDPLWSTYLGGGTDPMTQTDGSPPVVHDGVLWIESTLHTLNGLDLVTGEIRHVYRYEPRTRPYTGSSYMDTNQVTNEPVSLLAVTGETLVYSSRWGDQVVAFEPRTARLRWAAPKGPSPALFAADEERVYLSGQEIQAYEMETGARLWSWTPEGGNDNYGLAAYAEGKIYAPSNGRIFVLDAATGQQLDVLNLIANFGDTPGYMAVHVQGNRLLVSSREKVVCYEGAP